MAQATRDVLRDLLAKGAKDVEIKATYTGRRNSFLVKFADINVAHRSLTHLHVEIRNMVADELARLDPGDRVLMVATPCAYTSDKHPDGTGVTITNVRLVKRLNRTRKGKISSR
jgi:hypothetical protein